MWDYDRGGNGLKRIEARLEWSGLVWSTDSGVDGVDEVDELNE